MSTGSADRRKQRKQKGKSKMDITQILVAAIGAAATVVVAIITSVLVPWIKANTSESQQEILEAACKAAVLFVQQTMSDSTAEEKFSAAAEAVEAFFANYDMTLSVDVLKTEIESALKELKLQAGASWE